RRAARPGRAQGPAKSGSSRRNAAEKSKRRGAAATTNEEGMNRRNFLIAGGVGGLGVALADRSRPLAQEPSPPRWPTFDITTRLEGLQAHAKTRVSLQTPLPAS